MVTMNIMHDSHALVSSSYHCQSWLKRRSLSPGVVRTNLWQSMSAAEREHLFESVGKSLPVGRVGEPHDIAQAYVFLMQEEFATGQTVVVDAGMVVV